jgi:hypothetical protein
MSGPVQPQGAAESDASAHLGVRSHVPGKRRNRAQAEEAGIQKAKPRVESAHKPQPLVRELHCERLCRSQVVGILGKEANPLGQ